MKASGARLERMTKKRRVGRPAGDPLKRVISLSVGLRREQVDRLERTAARPGASRSSVLQAAVDAYFTRRR